MGESRHTSPGSRLASGAARAIGLRFPRAPLACPDPPVNSAPQRWTLVAALALGLVGLLELIQFLVVLPDPSVYAVLTHLSLSVLALCAGLGLWWRARWAPWSILALGFALALIRLIEGFVLGVRPWLFALLAAVAALGVALLLARWVEREAL